MGRHTPGPWAVGYGMDIIHFEGDGGVQICIPPADKWGAKDWHDNARLIAAAPDLLETCEMVLEFASIEMPQELIDKATAAIAKAGVGE